MLFGSEGKRSAKFALQIRETAEQLSKTSVSVDDVNKQAN